MLVKCDKCEEEFNMNGLQIESLELDIERYYFECPNCQKQYTSYLLNDEAKKLQKQTKDKQSTNPIIKKKRRRLKKIMGKLKRQYG